jgi:hypothetical protein
MVVGNSIDSLAYHLGRIAEHAKPTPWSKTDNDDKVILIFSVIAGLLSFIAIPTLYYTRETVKMTRETAANVVSQTEQQAINKRAQEAIFRDLIRHLYRNKIVVCAMRWRLETEGMDKYYPSEEHLLKLKVLPEDLRLDRFNNTPDHYDKLHAMELLFRNYSIEADVTLEHLKLRSLPARVKLEDLRTLEFKSQYLTMRICELMNDTGMYIDVEAIRTMLLREVDQHKKVEKAYYKPADVPPREGAGCRYYDDDLKLTGQLDEDISREYGVIKLIEFSNISRARG